MQQRFYGMNGAESPSQGLMAAISYAVYIPTQRRGSGSPLNVRLEDEKWRRFANYVQTAARASETVGDYISSLCDAMKAPPLSPRLLRYVVYQDNCPMIVYLSGNGDRLDAATDLPTSHIHQPWSTWDKTPTQTNLALANYRALVNDACDRQRCTESQLIDQCRGDKANLIAAICNLREMEWRELGIKPSTLNDIEAEVQELECD